MDKNNKKTNPWLSIWRQPRETITQVIHENHKTAVAILVYLAGINLSLNLSLNLQTGDFRSMTYILIASLARGILYGLIAWVVASALILWIGKLFKGVGTWREVRHAYAWAQIPVLGYLIITWPLNIIVFGEDLFTSNIVFLSIPKLILNSIGIIVDIVIGIWYVFIMSQAVGAVHKFSGWKGFFTILLGAIVFVVAFVSLLF